MKEVTYNKTVTNRQLCEKIDNGLFRTGDKKKGKMFETIRKTNVVEEMGFTLIELLIVVAIIGILAAIAIPGYLGMQERSKRGAVVRAASASEPELQAWLNSALKGGIGGALHEVDSNSDGKIDNADSANSELSANGLCVAYVGAQSVKELQSPWGAGYLWVAGTPGNGQIGCLPGAGTSSYVTLSALDKSGSIIHTKTIFTD